MMWPNPRLQRTPSASPPSPLSRKPLGVGRARCAPASRAEPEQGSAESPQAASRGITRITAPAPWPSHAGRRLRAFTSRRILVQIEKVLARRAAPNKSLHRTPAAAPPSPVSSKPLGSSGQGVGRACGESLVSGRRSKSSQVHGRRPEEQPGPAGFRLRGLAERRAGWQQSHIAQMLYLATTGRLNHPAAPNPRLQRTPSASPPSPLSRKPLGAEVRS